jgi:hypothetical protein
MLRQQIAVPILLPRAVAVLADNPLADGDYYHSDLLYVVVRLPELAWHSAAYDRDRLATALRGRQLPHPDVHTDLRHAVDLSSIIPGRAQPTTVPEPAQTPVPTRNTRSFLAGAVTGQPKLIRNGSTGA